MKDIGVLLQKVALAITTLDARCTILEQRAKTIEHMISSDNKKTQKSLAELEAKIIIDGLMKPQEGNRGH